RQVGDHGDRAVIEADRACVLAGGLARCAGTIAVLERDGPIEPVADGLGAAQGVGGLVLQEDELLGGQSGDVADGHAPELIEGDAVGDRHHHPPHAAGLLGWSAVLARICSRSYSSTSSRRYTTRPPSLTKRGPSPVQRQRSSVRWLMFQRAASSIWFKCLSDVGVTPLMCLSLHPAALERLDMRAFLTCYRGFDIIRPRLSRDVRARKSPGIRGFQWASCDVG